MIEARWVRTSINQQVRRITRMLRWSVECELVDPDVHLRCKAVAGLRFGRSVAAETERVLPAEMAEVMAVEPFVSRQVWAMIQLQLATGKRPGEVRSIRLCDIDRSNKTWMYKPASHKTQHHGRGRRVFIGKKGQAIIRQFLNG